jgi:hypothetical protein
VYEVFHLFDFGAKIVIFLNPFVVLCRFLYNFARKKREDATDVVSNTKPKSGTAAPSLAAAIAISEAAGDADCGV